MKYYFLKINEYACEHYNKKCLEQWYSMTNSVQHLPKKYHMYIYLFYLFKVNNIEYK